MPGTLMYLLISIISFSLSLSSKSSAFNIQSWTDPTSSRLLKYDDYDEPNRDFKIV